MTARRQRRYDERLRISGLRRSPGLRRAARWLGLSEVTRPALTNIGRLTIAGVIAYLFTLWLTPGPADLTGALTALLVVQASAYSTLRMSLVRVGAVLTGVLVAVALSSWVGLTWWSLGAAIAASLLLATVLRLREQALETPISAMLILAVGGQDIAAETRVATTLIGAAVGVALNLLLPPPVPTRTAIAAVRSVASRQADTLLGASAAMAERPITRQMVSDWLDAARGAAAVAERAATSVGALKDLRRLNTRAIGTTDAEPALHEGLDALDHSLLAVRALFLLMVREAPEHETPDDGYGDEVRAAFSVVLANVADCLDAFGALVQAEASGDEADVGQRLTASLEVAREARAILTELLFVDARAETTLWLLRGSILAAVEQILTPLNLEDRARRREARMRRHGPRLLTSAAPLLRDMLPTPWVERLRTVARPSRRGRADGETADDSSPPG